MIGKTKISETLSSLKIRNFRLYIIGQFISSTGTWMQNIGLAWLVLKLTNSGTVLGITIALQFVPILVFGPWAGVITDRFQKYGLLFFTQSMLGFIALSLGILVATNSIHIWLIYILAFSVGLMNAVDSPTRQTFIHEMVGRDNLMNAVSLNSVQNNLSRAIGPAIAAILIAIFGLAPLFLFNALTYVVVVITLSMIDVSKLNIHPTINKIKGQLTEGLRYIKSSPAILYTLLMMAIIGTLTYEFSVSLPLLAKFTFQGTATTFALLTAALGIGSVFGGINTASRKKINFGIVTRNAFFFALSVLIFAVAPTLTTALIFLIFVGFFSINFLSFANVLLQTESIPQMRGRVMSLWTVALLGSTAIGGPIIGWVGQHIGPRYSLILGGLAALLASAIGFFAIKNSKHFSKIPVVKIAEKEINLVV
jgi:MFS family permease